MATIQELSRDFKGDILDSSNTRRKYRMINNSDGTVSFEDVTVYSQQGSEFGAKEVNEERENINNLVNYMEESNPVIQELQQHLAALYNNNSSAKTCYLKYEFLNGDKATIYVTATRSGTVNGLRKYTIIRGEALAYSTIQQGSGGVGWNGEQLLNAGGSPSTGTDACILALTNVQGYATVEAFSSNLKITEAYFA